jgi:multidrug efflux pump
MSVSLIAVFIPILLMGGIVGRLFREFAVTISVAILISLAVSLSTTPMMCALLLRRDQGQQHGWLYRASELLYEAMRNGYRSTLGFALRNRPLMMLILLTTVGLNFYLYDIIPKGFFPQQDTGRLMGSIQADQSISFQLMQKKLTQFVSIIKNDHAVDTVVGFTGGGQTNSGNVYVSLRPLSERKISADQVIERLRPELAVVPGASLFLQAAQDIRVGGRQGNAQYQYTMQGATLPELNEWGPRVTTALQGEPQLTDVNSDQQDKGLEANLVIDRDTAARLGLTVSQIDNTLYDAFGQRQVSTIFVARNQYHVIMEVAPKYWQNPETLNDVYVSTLGGSVGGSQATNAVAGTLVARGQPISVNTIASDAARNLATNSIGTIGHHTTSTGSAVSTGRETMIPLSAVSHFWPGAVPLGVNHQGLFVANTISFNLRPDVALGTAVDVIEATMNRLGVPATIHGTFQGTAKAFQDSLANQPFLIVAALITIYIVLGILYESYFHPLTILSTLPSAGVGALLALMAFQMEFSIMSLIGVILLIGIVKKNAIMMIDFALEAQRTRGLSALAAIHEACLLRFRPIMMTTMAAMLGALPLAIGIGEGSELRRPLGIAIVGGLVLSQMLTLYTTPVIYLYIDQFRLWCQRFRGAGHLPFATETNVKLGE